MSTNDPQLILRPIVQGITGKHKTVISSDGASDILAVTPPELNLITNIAAVRPKLSQFLNNNFSGENELTFKQSIELIVRLHSAGMFESTSESLSNKLSNLATQTDQPETGGTFHRLAKRVSGLASIELMNMPGVTAPAGIQKALSHFVSPLGVALAVLLLALGGAALWANSAALATTVLEEVFAKPESFLLQAVISIAGALNIIAIIQALLAFGAGAKHLQLQLRLFCLCFPVLIINDDKVFLSKRSQVYYYFALALLAAPVCCLLAWWASGQSVTGPLGLLASGFGFVVLVQTCPFFRSPIIKFSEALLVELNILRAANRYLTQGLLADLVKLLPGKSGVMLQNKQEQSSRLDIWTAFHATFTLTWLYATSLMFLDLLIASVPELMYRVTNVTDWGAATAAGFMLFSMSSVFLAIVLKFTKIILQNIYSVSATPLRKARSNLTDFRSNKIPVSEAVTNFLQGIPILSHIEPKHLGRLTELLAFADYKPGQTIINQGDGGDRFFIMAVGEAKITAQMEDGAKRYIDTLRPGDSFGEIALIQNVTRQASIHAVTPTRVLILHRSSFDKLFQPGSVERDKLTTFINLSRLVQESQALSYLTPVQIQKFVHHAETVKYKQGEAIISEGDEADDAFLVIEGQAKVATGSTNEYLASLTRGDLFGMIALVKNIPRTASVIAESDIECLRVRKSFFIQLCMENLYVGSLVAELSDQQLAELQEHQEAG